MHSWNSRILPTLNSDFEYTRVSHRSYVPSQLINIKLKLISRIVLHFLSPQLLLDLPQVAVARWFVLLKKNSLMNKYKGILNKDVFSFLFICRSGGQVRAITCVSRDAGAFYSCALLLIVTAAKLKSSTPFFLSFVTTVIDNCDMSLLRDWFQLAAFCAKLINVHKSLKDFAYMQI